MKHFILLILFTGWTSMYATAQKLFFVFGHAEYASPVGELRGAHTSGLGIEIGGGVGMNKTFFTATLGYTWLTVNRRENSTNTNGGLRYTPYKVGVRRYVLLKNLFVKADAGLATMNYIDKAGKTSQFTTSIGAGVKFTRFEFVTDFNSVTKYGSWFGIKLGTVLGL